MKLEANLTVVTSKNAVRTGRVTLHPPKADTYYGNGYYMLVEMDGGREYNVDIRYEHTTDIVLLATKWAKGFWGEKASEITVE